MQVAFFILKKILHIVIIKEKERRKNMKVEKNPDGGLVVEFDNKEELKEAINSLQLRLPPDAFKDCRWLTKEETSRAIFK